MLIDEVSFDWLRRENLVENIKTEIDQTIKCFKDYALEVDINLEKLTLSKFEDKNIEQTLI
jgi:hypothetical protein